jgi:hypothetical protein
LTVPVFVDDQRPAQTLVSPPTPGATPGQAPGIVAIRNPGGVTGQLVYLIALNSTPYTQLVDEGGSTLGYLPPGATDLYRLKNSGGDVKFRPLTPAAGNPTNPPDNTLFCTWTDTKPIGSYPAALATPTVSITGTTPVTGNVYVTGGTINLGQAIQIAAGQSVSITGTTTVSGAITVTGGTVNIGNPVNIGTITGAVTLAAGQTINIGTITGTVTLAAGQSINIGTITGTVTLAASSVTIGNVGSIVNTVSVMDLPAAPIATAGGSGTYTVGPVPSGMKALLFTLSGPAPCLATVTGGTTNIIYAYQVPVSTITPTIVPIDPGTDASYTITFINPPPGAGIGICYAFSQPPILPPRSKLLASTYGQTVSGNVATWCGLFGPDYLHVTRLHSLRWTVASATSATGNSVCTIIIAVLGLTSETVIRVNIPPAGATVSEGMNFGEEGVALIPGSSNLAYFIGQTSSSAASIVALTAEYSLA